MWFHHRLTKTTTKRLFNHIPDALVGPVMLVAALGVSSNAHSQELATSSDSVVISSQKGMVWNDVKRTATFNGDVTAHTQDWKLAADSIIATFDDNNRSQLLDMVAENHVTFSWKDFYGSSPIVLYQHQPMTVRFSGLGQKKWVVDNSEIYAEGDGIWDYDTLSLDIEKQVRIGIPQSDIVGEGDRLHASLIAKGQDRGKLATIQLEGSVSIRFSDHYFSGESLKYDHTTKQGNICGQARWLWNEFLAAAECYDFDLNEQSITTRNEGYVQWRRDDP